MWLGSWVKKWFSNWFGVTDSTGVETTIVTIYTPITSNELLPSFIDTTAENTHLIVSGLLAPTFMDEIFEENTKIDSTEPTTTTLQTTLTLNTLIDGDF